MAVKVNLCCSYQIIVGFSVIPSMLVFVWARFRARTYMQLALADQQSMLTVQHRLRLTMQHVHGHSGNLGNECADHAAALGSNGLVFNHNLASLGSPQF